MLVSEASVCCSHPSGDHDLAPRNEISGRRFHQVYGDQRPSLAANRAQTCCALQLSSRTRNRVGLSDVARKHARFKRERNVYRSGGHVVGWRGIYGAAECGSSGKVGLFGKTRGAGAGHGRYRGPFETGNAAEVSGTAFENCIFSPVTHIPSYLFLMRTVCTGGVVCSYVYTGADDPMR